MSGSGADTDYLVNEDGQPVETLPQLVRANQVARIEKRNRIIAQRRQGFTYDQIAENLGKGADGKAELVVSPEQCGRIVREYVESLAAENADNAEVLRQIDNDRLEKMFRRLELDVLQAADGKERADLIRAQLKVIERHARLNGLDEPQRHRVEGDVNHHLIADREHVAHVDESFAKRHGKKTLALPLPGDAREVK